MIPGEETRSTPRALAIRRKEPFLRVAQLPKSECWCGMLVPVPCACVRMTTTARQRQRHTAMLPTTVRCGSQQRCIGSQKENAVRAAHMAVCGGEFGREPGNWQSELSWETVLYGDARAVCWVRFVDDK